MHTEQIRVTIIIVNWNSGKLLSECLRCLEKQTVRCFQIIVLDNASDDGSADFEDSFKHISVLKMQKNIGFAAGNNLAIAKCQTEFVALLNPDAFVEPNWLENLLIATNNFPDVAAFGSRQLCEHNLTILDGIGDSYYISGRVKRDRHGLQQEEIDLRPREIFSPCAAAALYRRQALCELGGFDEDYFCYIEDIDLGFRLRLAGYKSRYVPDAVVHHVGSATTGGHRSDFSIYHGHRNLVWTFVKNVPGFLFWLLLPTHIGLNLASLVWFTLNGHRKVIFRAKRDALLGLPLMWRKRKRIQANRVASVKSIWDQLDKGILKK